MFSLGGAVAGIFAIPRDRPPSISQLQAAGQTIDTAISRGARDWAPAPLIEARALHEEAYRLRARQQGRLPLLRDYELARQAVVAAGARADLLLTQTEAARETARASSDLLIAEAGTALAAARQAGNSARLRGGGRATLKKAEVALQEAKRLHQREAFAEAATRSRWIVEQSRHWERRSLGVLSRLGDETMLRRWRAWQRETIEWSARSGKVALVVDKAARRLHVYRSGRLERTYRIDLGRNPIADKFYEGDNATPEGQYRVIQVKGPGQSIYYRAFLIDYPNDEDWKVFREARRKGRIPRGAGIGGLIEIHGHGGRGEDWTRGCVAVTDLEMDELARRVTPGTPVTIVGSLEKVTVPAAGFTSARDSGGEMEPMGRR